MGKRARRPEPQEKTGTTSPATGSVPIPVFSGVVPCFSPSWRSLHPSFLTIQALPDQFSLGIIPDFSTGLHSCSVPKPNFPSWRSPGSSSRALTIQALPAQLSLGIILVFSTGLSQFPHPYFPFFSISEIPKFLSLPLQTVFFLGIIPVFSTGLHPCSVPNPYFPFLPIPEIPTPSFLSLPLQAFPAQLPLGILPVFCIPGLFPVLSIPEMSSSHFSCSVPTQTQLSLGTIPVFCPCSAPSPNFPIPEIPMPILPCSASPSLPSFPLGCSSVPFSIPGSASPLAQEPQGARNKSLF